MTRFFLIAKAIHRQAIKIDPSGQTVFGTEITAKIPNLLSKSASFHYQQYGLSEREYEVMQKTAPN